MAQGKRRFDLSKFSYDAARAGVVPSLGDCAVTSRRSSAQRTRGWSSASFEPGDDAGLFGSSNMSSDVAKPERQPACPPAEPLAEKDVGFAKFLKRHSSPTHTRVTAGGRIVPMERREPVPRFHLPESDRRSEPRSDANPPGSNNFGRVKTPSSNGQLQAPDHNHTPGNNDAGLENVPCPDVSMLSGGQMLGSSAYFTPQVPFLGLQAPMMYPGYVGSMPDWQSLAMLSASGGMLADAQVQSVYTTGQMVQDAEALFSNLDRQLRLIDRHRAMMSHDPNLAAQRMAVVQQRAECKEQIHRLKTQLQAEQSRSAYFHPMAFASSMPATFMPLATTPIQQNAPVGPASMPNPTIRPNALTEKQLPGSKRKVIPIVPPPLPSPTQAEPCKKPAPVAATRAKIQHRVSGQAAHCSDGPLTDKVGQACPVLEQSRENDSTTRGDAVPAPDRKRESVDERQETESSPANDDAEPAPEKKLPDRRPDDVEAIYELQLDAMRLPEGVHVVIALSNGAHVSVPGSNLGRPRSSQMSEFERQYWRRKPKFTSEMLEKIKARATIEASGGPASDEYLISNADGPPATPPRQEASKARESNEREKKEGMEKQSSHGQGGTSGGRAAEKAGPCAAKDGPRAGNHGGGASVTERRGNENLPSGETAQSRIAEELSQKGYSSVLVQNVNVEVQLPPPGLDGATEANGRSAAVLSLTATGKQRSPRLLRQSAPNGGA